ncbi:MAG TPA: hypothetical protein VGB07_34125 [Blastocatellia bacterium]
MAITFSSQGIACQITAGTGVVIEIRDNQKMISSFLMSGELP